MELIKPLNIFYEEPDPDRWLRYDRYPRRIIRRLVRGKSKPGGVMMVALNLIKGLKRIGQPFRFNDYKNIDNHPQEIACVIGKPHLLAERVWRNPVIFGAGIFSHPIECLDLFERYPFVKRILVPGPWMKDMFDPFYPGRVAAWPVGIDTDDWPLLSKKEAQFDFLIYDKIRWEHDKYQRDLIDPICQQLDRQSCSYQFLRYGHYTHAELKQKLANSKAVIFLCEHESQGQAYQQILATGTPILAWDREGYWQDPYYYPEKVSFQPVSSVPYWDNRCGIKFRSAEQFPEKLASFLNKLNEFSPRNYIIENLTLEICAQKYIDIFNEVQKELA